MKRKSLTIVIALVVVFLAIASSAFLIKNKARANINNDKVDIINVKTQAVDNKNIVTSIEYTGRVNSFENVSISAEVTGKIMQGDVYFKEGEYFNQGALLISIYNEDYVASLKGSKSNFLRTLSTVLPDLKIDYPNSYQKWLSYFNSISLDASMPVLPNFDDDKEKIFMASNSVISEYYTIYQKEITLSKYNIYAPFNGYFKTVNKEVGAIASMGAELAQIIRADKLEISVPVLTQDIHNVIEGQAVNVELNGNVYEAKVSRVAGFVDQSTQSVNVYVELIKTKDVDIYEGEYVNVIFEAEKDINGIELPREAVIENKNVYIIENSCLKLAEVEILQQLEDSFIIGGLEDGDTVVSESLINVKEGQKVGY